MNILKSFLYALQGIWHCVKTQRNFRFHIVAAITVLIISSFYEFDRFETALLFLAIFLVLICEMINTAIESAIDMHGNKYNIHAKISKDVAAGGVLLSAIFAFVIAIKLFLNSDKITNVIGFFIKRPYLWPILVVYTVISICFIMGFHIKKQ